MPRSTILSLSIICLTIFVFVPWQVAYVGCWLLHLYTCASSAQHLAVILSSERYEAVPLVARHRESTEDTDTTERSSVPRLSRLSDAQKVKENNLRHNMHLLLLMTWLLPLTAPVLAVWVRTLLTAGYTTPFDGDHNFLAVLPFLIFVDFASWTPGPLFERTKWVLLSTLAALYSLILIKSLLDSRSEYLCAGFSCSPPAQPWYMDPANHTSSLT